MQSPVGAALIPSAPKPNVSRAMASAIVLVILYSLTLAAGGATVFYASIRPVSIPEGYFSFIDAWYAAYSQLAVTWLAGPVILLIVGLIHVHQSARGNWWLAVAWIGALAAGTAIGYMIMHGYGLLFAAYPRDLDGSPLGPSRWAPGAPYWQALLASAGQLAVGAAMLALITAPARKALARP